MFGASRYHNPCYRLVTMNRRYHLSRRRRTLWVWAVLFCLLFQQLAMASYVCTPPTIPAHAALTGECAAMRTGSKVSSAHVHATSDPRCDEHCSNNVTSSQDAHALTVPPVLLPSQSPVLLGTSAPALRALPSISKYRSDPPPMLRFCTLLI